ncbi:MAG: YdcF family protein [Anaerolinea sp.]|nr:YdcF family protein [Anaerolinea sp.]
MLPRTPTDLRALQADYEIIFRYLSVTDALEASDVIFVFGGYHLSVPKKAGDLYRTGVAPKIMVTGKDGSGTRPVPDWDEPIGVVFHRYLRSMGIPDEAIHVMSDSTNTLEDVLLGIPVLQQMIPDLSRITLVTRPIHQRRALATSRKAYPQYSYISSPAAEAVASLDDDSFWSREQVHRTLGEIERLKRYAAKGDIEAQVIPVDVELSVRNLIAYQEKYGL